ncbi:MAG: hypothetical protein KUG77_12575 [Nannocystaceae bacterium]|nr:hypothetical protein [Nannocystaceae bacterium]
MAQASEKIAALLERLEQSGAEPLRLDALRITQAFKRSWVELAETLVQIRDGELFEPWGFEEFYAYCTQELHLRRATVDKLVMSFSTLKRLAPSVLRWDGVEKEVPSLQAVDYFGKAVNAANKPPEQRMPSTGEAPPAPREVLKDLRAAVFDEGQSVAELRRRFDPILRPKPQGTAELDTIQKALAAARKLAEILPEIDGLEDDKVVPVEKALGLLRESLETLAEPLRDAIAVQKKAAKPKVKPKPAKKPPQRASGQEA